MINTKPLNVLIADDHPIVRQGLSQLIEQTESLTFVGAAETGEEAIFLASKCDPDVVLMDLQMPGMGGLEAMRIIAKNTSIKVIGLSSYSDKATFETMQQIGVSGFLLKEALAEEIVDVIQRVHEGERVFAQDPQMPLALPESDQCESTPPILGAQQKRILALMTKGLTNPELAELIGISRTTVSYHVSAILRKLEVSNRAEAVAIAIRENLVDHSDF